MKIKNTINNSLSSNTKMENWLIISNDTTNIEVLTQVLESFKAANLKEPNMKCCQLSLW